MGHNLDRGGPHGPTPPTPPGLQVCTKAVRPIKLIVTDEEKIVQVK